MIYKTALLLFIFLFCSSVAGATTYYVETGGSDSAPGSEASPWLTIQKAADTMLPGDTVLVKEGTYTTQGTCGAPAMGECGIKPKTSGTVGLPITYKAYTGHKVIIDQLDAANYYGFYIFNKNYITISGFEIRNVNTRGGVFTTDVCSNIIIENNHIHDVNGCAGCNTGAVKIDSCDSCTVRDNRLHDITVNGSMSNQNGAGVQSIDMSNAIIENNAIFNASTGVYHKRSTGAKGAIIRNNLIYDTTLRGLFYAVAGIGDPAHLNQEVYENIFYNIPNAIDIITYETATDSTGFSIYNNVFATTRGVYIWGYKDVNMWNNIFYNITDKSIKTQGAPALNSITISDYNLFYPDANFVLHNEDASLETYGSLAAWQGGTAFGAISLDSDPAFVDATNRDYRLQGGSPAVNAGSSDGTGGGSATDMGAYPGASPATNSGEIVGPITPKAPTGVDVN